jgi:hypothetical protein
VELLIPCEQLQRLTIDPPGCHAPESGKLGVAEAIGSHGGGETVKRDAHEVDLIEFTCGQGCDAEMTMSVEGYEVFRIQAP